MYPNAAGKIVSKAPYKSKEDMCAAGTAVQLVLEGGGVWGNIEVWGVLTI